MAFGVTLLSKKEESWQTILKKVASSGLTDICHEEICQPYVSAQLFLVAAISGPAAGDALAAAKMAPFHLVCKSVQGLYEGICGKMSTFAYQREFI